MERHEAEEIALRLAQQLGPCKAVSAVSALAILGEERFERMKRDPIRKNGPCKDWFYPWNVADYLQFENL